jgi:thioredoxin-related protein
MKSLLYLPVLLLTLFLPTRASSNIDFFEGQLADLQRQASEYGKMSMVYFYASWCMPCQWMEKNTYQDRGLADYLNQYYFPIRVNIDAPEGLQEKKKYQVTLLPTILIFDHEGNLVARYEESMDSDKLLNLLKKNNQITTPSPIKVSKVHSPVLQAPRPKNIYYPPLIPEQTFATPTNKPVSEIIEAPLANTDSYSTSYAYHKPSIDAYFSVQVGAFSNKHNAETEMKLMKAKIGEELHLLTEQVQNRTIYKIIAGKFQKQNEAILCMQRIKRQKIFGFVKKIDTDN